jgi:D-alanyl-D-alanine carboxypeptidase
VLGVGLLVVLAAVLVPEPAGTRPPDREALRAAEPSAGTDAGGAEDREPVRAAPVPVRREPPPPGETPDPASLLVLVDHDRHLPPGWVPPALVTPASPFTFAEQDPKRTMRPEAAAAFDELVAAAAADGLTILGVSAYRSEEVQRRVFEQSASQDGEVVATASTARPGHSEHQTGLAVDVTAGDGRCPAEECFADTPEARWLEERAHEFGFIVRYPAGAEATTGYRYEPWHLRFVGRRAATTIAASGTTLDEYLGAA